MRLTSSLLFAAFCVVPAFSATINFSTFTGNRYDPVSSFTQNGFTAAATAGSWYYETIRGNGAPEIVSQNGTGATLTVTGAGNFFFNSIDIGNNSLAYTITGFLGIVQQFTFSGTTAAGFFPDSFTSDPAIGGATYTTVNNSWATTAINSLTITGTSYGAFNTGIDNIVLTDAAAPEPATLVLVGGALVALAGLRRRFTGRLLTSRAK